MRKLGRPLRRRCHLAARGAARPRAPEHCAAAAVAAADGGLNCTRGGELARAVRRAEASTSASESCCCRGTGGRQTEFHAILPPLLIAPPPCLPWRRPPPRRRRHCRPLRLCRGRNTRQPRRGCHYAPSAGRAIVRAKSFGSAREGGAGAARPRWQRSAAAAVGPSDVVPLATNRLSA